MLADDGQYDPKVMAHALRVLPTQPLPSSVVVPGLLEGLDNVARLAAPSLNGHRRVARTNRRVAQSG